MRLRLWIGRLLLVLLSSGLWLGLTDLVLRRSVGACGLTPFRNSAIEALPHELVPGRVTTYKGVPVRINQAGFRGAELTDPPEGCERIALIGDSYTFGNGCPEEQTLAALLESELRARGHPAQVVNCGVPAYNAVNVLTWLRERVLELRPRRVIYVNVANDVSAAQRKTVIPDDATIDPCADFPLGSPLLQFAQARMTGLARAAGFKLDGYVENLLAKWRDGGGERVAQAIAQMNEACAAQGVAFAVAVYPYLIAPTRNPFRAIQDDCVRRCRERAIPCFPIEEAFSPDEELTRYWVAPLDAHPDGGANERAARFIADQLLVR